ncbi:MAG: hypothetical protein ACFFCZ_10880 [Promethearchaeota archaeon]
MTEVIEKAKGLEEDLALKETISKETLGSLDIKAIEGIAEKIASKFKAVGINTIEELKNCNPFLVYRKVGLPLHKVIELKNKALMALQLRFDKEIVEELTKRGFSIQKAIEADPRVLKKIAKQDIERVVNFLDAIAQLSIFISADASRQIKVGSLGGTKIDDGQEARKLVLPEEEERERFRAVIANTKIALLLERMLEGFVKELTPRWALSTKLGFGYPEAEEVVNPNNEIVNKILNDLYEVGIFSRHFFDKISRCPHCDYLNLSMRYSCIRCGTRNMVQDEMIEHYDCGHVDLSRRFKTKEGKLVCPKCAKNLKQLGLDYSKPGIMFECRDCGDITGSPYRKFLCLNCNGLMKRNEIILDEIWSYTLNDEKKYLLIELLNPKREIMTLLARKGFNINGKEKTEHGKIRGKSQICHYFDIYAENNSSSLLIDFASDENLVEIQAIYDLFAKTQDIDANISVLFAFPEASADAKEFAKYHNITILEAENLSNIIPKFKDKLDDLLKVKFRP